MMFSFLLVIDCPKQNTGRVGEGWMLIHGLLDMMPAHAKVRDIDCFFLLHCLTGKPPRCVMCVAE